MTFRVLFILTLLTGAARGQATGSLDVLEIIKAGVRDNKLTRELVNNVDSINATEPQHYPLTIPVQLTKENGLKQGENIKWDKIEIWVWGEEDLFMFDGYWITPGNIRAKGDKVTFDYSTHTWFDKNVTYYKGTLKAEKVNGQWVIKDSKVRETKNTFDGWKKLGKGNER